MSARVDVTLRGAQDALILPSAAAGTGAVLLPTVSAASTPTDDGVIINRPGSTVPLYPLGMSYTPGPRTATTTTRSGGILSTQGQVWRNVKFTSKITIAASGQKFFDCTFDTASDYAVFINDFVTDTEFGWCDFNISNLNGGQGCLAGPNGATDTNREAGNVWAHHCRFTGYGDGVKLGYWYLVEYCYVRVRRAPNNTAKHVDGIQDSGKSNSIVRYNWIEQTYSAGHNSAFFTQGYNGSVDKDVNNVFYYGNHINGGVYTVHNGQGKTSTNRLHNIQIYDNVFYRGFIPPQWDASLGKWKARGGLFFLTSGVVNGTASGSVLGGWCFNDSSHAAVPSGSLLAFPGDPIPTDPP